MIEISSNVTNLLLLIINQILDLFYKPKLLFNRVSSCLRVKDELFREK